MAKLSDRKCGPGAAGWYSPSPEQKEASREQRQYFEKRTHLTLEGLYLRERSGTANLASAFVGRSAKAGEDEAVAARKSRRRGHRQDPPWHLEIVSALTEYMHYSEFAMLLEARKDNWSRTRRESRERMIKAARAVRHMLDDVRVAYRLRDRLGLRDSRLSFLHRLPNWLVAEAEVWAQVPASEDELTERRWRELLHALRQVAYPPKKPAHRLSARLIAALVVGCGLRDDPDETLADNIEKILGRIPTPDLTPP